jgi:hypothetical protein
VRTSADYETVVAVDTQLEMSVAWEEPVPSEWREWGEVAGSEWFFDVNSRAEKIQLCLYSHSKDLVLVSVFASKLITKYLAEECGIALENDEELTQFLRVGLSGRATEGDKIVPLPLSVSVDDEQRMQLWVKVRKATDDITMLLPPPSMKLLAVEKQIARKVLQNATAATKRGFSACRSREDRTRGVLKHGLQALRASLSIYNEAFEVGSSRDGGKGLSETRAKPAAPYEGPQFKRDARAAIEKFEDLLGVKTETPEDRGNKHGRTGKEVVAPPSQQPRKPGLMLRRQVDKTWAHGGDFSS